MVRTTLIATVVVVVAAIAYFMMLGADEPVPMAGDAPAAGTVGAEEPGAVAPDNEAILQANTSNRVAADIATDGAFENAQAGREPVQDQVDGARAIAGQVGAVGGSAFTVAGYDRLTVVDAILVSDLDETRKEDLMAELDRAEPQEAQLAGVLAEVRLALALEQ